MRKTPVHIVTKLQLRIVENCDAIKQNIALLARVRRNFLKILYLCFDMEGNNFEALWSNLNCVKLY